MASYSPLQIHDLDHQPEDSEDDILLPSKHITSGHRTIDPPSKRPDWTALGLQVIAVICTCALYNIASASVPGVRNHNSVGVKRPYLHELSFDHSHYGVA